MWIWLQNVPEVSTAPRGAGGEDEDEAAKAVRSILGHNESLEVINDKTVIRSRVNINNFDSNNELEANKENSEILKR